MLFAASVLRCTLIKDYGGKPAENSGAWGAFVKLIEGGATVFGDRASVAGFGRRRRSRHGRLPEVSQGCRPKCRLGCFGLDA
ncbi:unnamed protein product [Sphagnum jensenii]